MRLATIAKTSPGRCVNRGTLLNIHTRLVRRKQADVHDGLHVCVAGVASYPRVCVGLQRKHAGSPVRVHYTACEVRQAKAQGVAGNLHQESIVSLIQEKRRERSHAVDI